MRFTHANRHCPEHPYDTLKRCDDFVIQAVTEQNHDVVKWLEKYKMEKEDRTPTRKTPKRTKHLCNTTNFNENEKNENFNSAAENECPVTPSNPYKSRNGLMVELDMNAGLGASPLAGYRMKPTPKVIQWQEPLSQEEDSADEFETPHRSTFNPKKRWMREAWQDDLARPLEQLDEQTKATHSDSADFLYATMAPPPPPPLPPLPSHNHIDPNQMRPTVLMVANKDKAMPLVDLSASASASPNMLDICQSPITITDYHHLPQPQEPYFLQRPTSNANTKRASMSSSCSSLIDGVHLLATSSPSTHMNDSSCSVVSTDSALDEKNAFNDIMSPFENLPPQGGYTHARKWMGAMALMQLATDDHASISTTSETEKNTPDELISSIPLHHSLYTEL